MSLAGGRSVRRTVLASGLSALGYGLVLVLMDIVVAHRYGTGTQAAIYQAAYMIPALLLSVFSGGAILGAFIPIFTRLGGVQHRPEAEAFLHASARIVLALLTLVAFVAVSMADTLAEGVASGFDSASRNEVGMVMRLMLPILVLHGLAYVFGAVLMARGRVGLVNLAPVLIPLMGLGTYPWWDEANGASFIAVGYLAGSAMFAVVLGVLVGFRPRLVFSSKSTASGEFFRIYVMTALAHAAMAVLLLLNQAVAGSVSARDLASFSYGIKLVLLALAFSTTVSTSVILPHFSAMANRVDHREIWRGVRVLVARTFVISMLVAMLWIFASRWVVDAAYVHGSFTDGDADLVASVQRAFLLQAPFYVVGVICWRILNAMEKWKPLAAISAMTLGFDALLVLDLSKGYGAQGIAVSHSVAIMLWSVGLLAALRGYLLKT